MTDKYVPYLYQLCTCIHAYAHTCASDHKNMGIHSYITPPWQMMDSGNGSVEYSTFVDAVARFQGSLMPLCTHKAYVCVFAIRMRVFVCASCVHNVRASVFATSQKRLLTSGKLAQIHTNIYTRARRLTHLGMCMLCNKRSSFCAQGSIVRCRRWSKAPQQRHKLAASRYRECQVMRVSRTPTLDKSTRALVDAP
jgi:hypothetical protein